MFEIKNIDLSMLTEKEKSRYLFYLRMQAANITQEFSNKVIKGLIDERKKKIENAIWGFVIGDCLGVPYEFRQKGTFKYKPMHGFGTHNQPPMTWSDDTALMLSLIDAFENGKFSIEKHKINLQELLKGRYYLDNILFDIGVGTRVAIQKNFQVDVSNSLGNGGLLRCWLVGILCKEQLFELIALTHSNGGLYMLCCNLYIALLNDILQLGKEEAIKKWKIEYEMAFDILINTNEKLSRTEGCIIETVRIVISSYIKGKTVKNVVELGGDTDSNAALFCALKGAEGDKTILKYKNQIRNFEQINYYIKQITNSTKDKVEEIPIEEVENFYHDIDLTSDSNHE